MTRYSISIVSDTICPWCYVGYRLLKAAIAKHLAKYVEDDFQIVWHPFQLNPNAPNDQQREQRHPLAETRGNALSDRLKSAGRSVGIQFNPARRAGNTLDSHRLIEFATQQVSQNTAFGASEQDTATSQQTLQTRLVEELFADYFERGLDIADHAVLISAATRAGIKAVATRNFLASNTLAQHVKREAAAARSAEGINGVPHFTINDVFEVEGAQETAAFLMLFERLKRREMKI